MDGRCGIASTNNRNSGGGGHGARHGERAFGKLRDFKNPQGPVPDDGLRICDDRGVLGARGRADVRPQPTGGNAAGRDFTVRARLELFGHDVVLGQPDTDAAAFAKAQYVARELELVVFNPGLSHLDPSRLQERVRHRAADQHVVGEFHQVLEQFHLVGNFCASHDGRVRPRRVLHGFREVIDFALHQEPCQGRRKVLGDAHGRSVRAVRGAERVIDVQIGERGEPARESLLIFLFLRMKAKVFE